MSVAGSGNGGVALGDRITPVIDRTGGEEAFLDAVLRSTGDAVLVLDEVAGTKGRVTDFKCRMANPACLTVLGVADVDLIGRDVSEALPELTRDAGDLTRVAASGADGEFDLEFQRGSETARLRLTAVKLKRGIVVIIADDTRRREYEDALRKAEERMRRVDDEYASMATSLSHEVRTQITNIVGFSDIIKSEFLGPISPPQYVDYIRDIDKSGRNLLDIINGLLDPKRFQGASRSDKDYRHLIELAPDLICICRQGRIVLMNPAGTAMLGERQGDGLVGRHLSDFAHPYYRELFADGLESLCDEKTRVPMIFVASDGRQVEVEIAALPYEDEDEDEGEGVMLIARDITERNRAAMGVTARENRLRTIMNTVADAIITIDHRGLIDTFNAAAEAIFGYDSAEIQGQPVTALMPEAEAARHPSHLDAYLSTGTAKILGTRREVKARHKDGTTFPADISVNEMKFGESQLFVGVIRDITARKEREDRLRFLATRDPLTELPNRHEFRERLKAAVARAEGDGHQLAVLFIDLDHFKNINDAMGHLAGDGVLQAASVRLQKCVRDGDTVANLGGDEFTVILDGIGEIGEAEAIAGRMLKTMAAPFRISGKEIFTSASIGVVIYPGHGDTIPDLMQNVDTAGHYAKKQGRNNFQFYSSSLSAQVQRRMEIGNGLRRALERDEFELMFQPKVDLETLEIIGAEALLRWDCRDLGAVSPVEFVPVAEESGLIEDIGEWVLRTARAEAVEWRNIGIHPVQLSVNVSARQFLRGDLAALVAKIIGEVGLEPELLDLELTESMVAEGGDAVLSILQDLKDMNVSLAIDDFGTGYSSLSRLTRMPINVVKVDRSFVTNLPENTGAVTMAKAIVSMAINLKLDIVAEGVETEMQKGFLNGLGCKVGQGYLFSKPVSSDNFRRMYAEGEGRIQPVS